VDRADRGNQTPGDNHNELTEPGEPLCYGGGLSQFVIFRCSLNSVFILPESTDLTVLSRARKYLRPPSATAEAVRLSGAVAALEREKVQHASLVGAYLSCVADCGARRMLRRARSLVCLDYADWIAIERISERRWFPAAAVSGFAAII